jgi:hypothetical protein
LLNVVAKEKMDLTVMDVPAAYLQTAHESLDGEDLYIRMDKQTAALAVMEFPHLAELLLPDGSLLCQVSKALYGLVESAWLWYRELTGTLSSLGYTFIVDLGLMGKTAGKDKIFTTLHVDDLKVGSSATVGGRALKKELIDGLNTKYPGIKLQEGPKYRHLACEIEYDQKRGLIRKGQLAYTLSILAKNHVTGVEHTPARKDLLSGVKKSTKKLDPKAHATYRSALQQVGYLTDNRPDLAFVVSCLQRYSDAPVETDLEDLRHLFKFLNFCPDMPLTFSPTDLQLSAKADASFAGHPDSRSHYGFTISLGGANNAPVMSKSGTIKAMTRSACEAEISGVNELASELLWASDIMEAMGYPQQNISILQDNQAAISMMQKEPRNFQTKSRHVRVKWEFFREHYKGKRFFLEYCPTEDMTADVLTKPLVGQLFRKHVSTLFNASQAHRKKIAGQLRGHELARGV